MKKLTYKEAYDKIIEAYFKDEIIPLVANFCFCGTLCNNSCDWEEVSGYSVPELIRMERALFSVFAGVSYVGLRRVRMKDEMDIELIYEYFLSLGTETYEDLLFDGMCLALDELKQIHKERGENV